MSDFDPYHIWLEIPPDEQPPTPHRLLGIAPDETDKETIREAALQRNAFIRQYSLGEQGKIAERLLNEIAAARDNILAGKVQTAIETPAPPETPIETVVEKSDPHMVIGIFVVGVIGVSVLFTSLIFSGDTGPVASISSDQSSAEMAAEKVAAEKAAVEKAAAEKAAAEKAAVEKAAAEKAAAEKAAAEKAAMEKSAMEKSAMEKTAAEKDFAVTTALARGDWKTVLSLDPDNSEGKQMQAAAEKKAAITAALARDDWKTVLSLDPDNSEGKQIQAAAEKATAEKDAILAGDPITNTFDMTFNKIPTGTFTMGSPEDEPGRSGDEHQHKVTITQPFYMQTTEVTQGQWTAVMGTEPWKGEQYVKEGPKYAATYLSWDDAVAFSKKLSEVEGKTYRLPTEAEWEYACRAGTKTTWHFGNDNALLGQYAWCMENPNNRPFFDDAHQVGLKKPNAFGLYDMHGNVWEWCYDYYGKDYYKRSLGKDPIGPAAGRYHVLRGGSCVNYARLSRSAYRIGNDAANRFISFYGFRVVRELDDSTQSTPPPVPPTAPAIESITNTIGMTLNKIPAGTFMMGSPVTEKDRESKETQHEVTISKAFYMQTTEVTQEQWTAVMDTEPWKGQRYVKEDINYPATHVSWNEAVAYCKKLSERVGKTYRLSTEAEWEYACRAGTQTAWIFGGDDLLGQYAWHGKNAWDIGEKYAHQVGLKKPNAFGLYDMHGNVWEWCSDYYVSDYYKQSLALDPTGPARGSSNRRVVRGGSWDDVSCNSRSACRNWFVADYRNYFNGFRVVRELD